MPQAILVVLSSFLLFTFRSHIYHTYAGHMSIRVHRRTRDLRTHLDKGAAGNTCRIVKLSLDHRIIESFLLITSRSHIYHTYAGQALLRVRGRAMHLRAGLNGEDAGNTCRIIESFLLFTFRSHICRTGAIKGVWESDAFACRFGRRRRR